MIYKLFKETQDDHKITSKELADAAEISPKHLSEFRSGRANITLDLLWRLVEAMEKLSPGARRDFGLRLAGFWEERSLKNLISAVPPQELVEAIDNEQLASLVCAFAETIKNSREEQGKIRSSDNLVAAV